MQSHSEVSIDPTLHPSAPGEWGLPRVGKIADDDRDNSPEIAVSGRLEAVHDRLDAAIMAVLLWDHPEISLICRRGFGVVDTGPLDPTLAAVFRDAPLDAFHRLSTASTGSAGKLCMSPVRPTIEVGLFGPYQ